MSLSRFFKDLVDDGGYAADGRKAGRRLDKAKIIVQALLLNNPVPPAVLEGGHAEAKRLGQEARGAA